MQLPARDAFARAQAPAWIMGIAGGIGAAALIAGVILYTTPPAFVIAPTPGGLSLWGRF